MDATVISPAEAVLAAVHADPRAASSDAQRIIDESTDERERVTARWALGFARRELSDLGQAESLMRAAIDGANQLGDVQLAARISTSLALVVMERDTPAAALELLEQPIAILRGADRARAVMQRGLIHYHLAQFDAALDDHHAAIDDLRAAGDWVALARLHVNVGSIQSYRRDFDAAEQSLADAIDLSELNGQALLAGYAHHNLGHLRALRGNVPEALRSFETAMERYTDLGAPPDRVATLMADRARTLSDAGLRAEAVEAIDIAYDLVRQGATDAEAADIGLLAASIRLDNGEVERAVEPAAWARATYALRGRSGWAPVAELLLLRARVHETDRKRAAEGSRLAADLERLGWIEEAQTALIFTADLHIRVGDLAAATHTRIEVAYGRPVARGRELFGALVPWDAVWHPGADSATVISLDHDLVVEGQPLPAGDYSLWLIPRERGPWTLIFSRAAHVFHQPFPGDSTAALRLEIQPATASHMESMAIYFSMVLREDAELRIHWGERVLPVRISAPWKPPASDSGSLQEGH